MPDDWLVIYEYFTEDFFRLPFQQLPHVFDLCHKMFLRMVQEKISEEDVTRLTTLLMYKSNYSLV